MIICNVIYLFTLVTQLANDKIKEMEEKMKDLNYQVRHELIRNENSEKVSI